MQKLPTTNERPYKWEVTIGKEVIELSERGYEQLLEKEAAGIRLVRIGDKVVNPAFIQSAKKVYLEPNLFNQPAWLNEPTKVVTEEQRTKMDELKLQVKAMLKKQNEYWKTAGKVQSKEVDTELQEHIEDTYQMLIGEVNLLSFPSIEQSGWYNNDLITHHTESKERHPVEAKIKKINLKLHEYKALFECEARWVFCETCKKHLQKRIYLFNNSTGNCYYKEY